LKKRVFLATILAAIPIKEIITMPLDHNHFMQRAYNQALKSYNEGGLPIGSVLIKQDGTVLGEGHNMRVQNGNPILHGEMSALQNAGRQKSYRDTILYTTLSPCMMCAGTIVQFKIPHVVVGEDQNFDGNIEFLRSRGVKVDLINHAECIALMKKLIAEKPVLWNEDIAED
jgi:cytosine/creatinine deaminase